MRILVLNGSPRSKGNTKQMVEAFREGAEAAGHQVDVCRMKINGCLACEYCHSKGNGTCIQKDDMQTIYELLKEAEMLVIASPIYYHGVSGQLKCVLDRFYSAAYPRKPKNDRLRYERHAINGNKHKNRNRIGRNPALRACLVSLHYQ